MEEDVSSDSAAEGRNPPSTLADKINFLFETVHPAGRGPYSLQEVADGIEKTTGRKVSHNTLWKLRTGETDNPTKRVLEAMGAFFGVDPAYFFDESVSRSIEGRLELLTVLRDNGVRGIQLRTFFELSDDAQEMIMDLIESTARREGRRRAGKR